VLINKRNGEYVTFGEASELTDKTSLVAKFSFAVKFHLISPAVLKTLPLAYSLFEH
jgi:hypothetical protein